MFRFKKHQIHIEVTLYNPDTDAVIIHTIDKIGYFLRFHSAKFIEKVVSKDSVILDKKYDSYVITRIKCQEVNLNNVGQKLSHEIVYLENTKKEIVNGKES